MQKYTDKTDADYYIGYNPEMYPNGTLCQTQDDGTLYIAFDGAWLKVGDQVTPP